ncbi:MAG: outer membrane lipoprotein carrier protein LolA [bacterium]
MKVKWLLAVLGLGFLVPAGLFAQSVSDLADRVQQTYEQAQDLGIDFTQKTYVALLEREVAKRGRATFKKPGKLAIRYEGERGRNYLSDGKTLWVFETGDAKPETYPLDEENVPAEALSFLGGLGRLKRDFAVEEVDPKKWAQLKAERGQLQWMELTPLKKRSSLQWLVMGFDPKTAYAREVFLFTDSGNLSHYVFDKVELNLGLGDELFVFKKK